MTQTISVRTRRYILGSVCGLIGLLLAPPLPAAPPKLVHLFPAGAAPGQTVAVSASGSFERWPVEARVDRPGVTVTAAEDKGKLNVVVAEDALPGVYWLRLYDLQGASALRPFMVGTLSEANEQEPNNAPDQAQRLEKSTTVNGCLEKSGDVDGFQMSLEAGQTLVAALDANRELGSPMDSVLQICDENGFVLEQNDDARGIDPLVVLVAPRSGKYVVRVFAFPATPNSTIGYSGSSTYIYRLTVTTGGFADHAFPLALSAGGSRSVRMFGWNLPETEANATPLGGPEPDLLSAFLPQTSGVVTVPVVPHASVVAGDDNDVEQPQTVDLPVTITGRIESERDVDAFAFAATKDQKLRFRVEADALGFLLDPLLTITDASGKVLAEVDDSNKRRDCELTWSVPADGDYQCRIRDLHGHGGFRYVYRLTAGEVAPDFGLKLESDTVVVMPDKPVEIKVAVDRRDGFAGEIVVSAVELPEGVMAETAVSAAQGDSAKSVKLSLRAAQGPWSGPIRIVGRSKGERSQERVARYTIDGFAAETTQVWLTISDKR